MATEVRLERLRGVMNDGQRRICDRATALLKKAVNDTRFRDKLLNHDFDGKTHFREANGRVVKKSNNEIFDIIARGRERGKPDDNLISLQVVLAPLNKGTVGSATLGKLPFKTAYWFVDRCDMKKDPISLARHFMHEWLHVAGFFHYGGNSARGDVPYGVGGLVRDLLRDGGSQFLDSEEAEDAVNDYLLEEADHLVDVDAAEEVASEDPDDNQEER